MEQAAYAEKLIQYRKKTITKVQMQKLFDAESDEELYEIVEILKRDGILEPVRNSSTNGNRLYPIYLKYRIHAPIVSCAEERSEISRLHPVIQSSGILQEQPELYRENRDAILMLDAYLFRKEAEPVPISRKERSFQIFGEEKMLDRPAFCSLLSRLGLGKEELAFYDTPEYCFNDFIPERKEDMVLLICENKDIWFNIRRRMFEDGASEIFGVLINGTVYGCGNRVSEKNALTSYTEFLGSGSVRYLYWGDIDRAGLNIYLSLRKNNPGLSIKLFVPGYEEMLERAEDRKIPHSQDLREIMGEYEPIFSEISEKNRSGFRHAIEENLRIPQEIITYATLQEKMR